MLLLLTFTSLITVNTASTRLNGLTQERMLRLINGKQKILPQDLSETIVSFIDNRSDAQIWFESFEDPNDRIILFNATTWNEVYDECQGSNQQIADRVNRKNYFKVEFDESSHKILDICIGGGMIHGFNPPRFKSLNLKHLKSLRSLQRLTLRAYQDIFDPIARIVPDFNGWSDELETIDLCSSELSKFAPVSFTGFPKKLSLIDLSYNDLQGKIVLPKGDIPNNLEIHLGKQVRYGIKIMMILLMVQILFS